MPRIFDNIEQQLLPALRETLNLADRADFCVGYFNLRGWGSLANLVEHLEGTDESCCRVLIGMHRPPEQVMREAQRAIQHEEFLDGPTTARLKRQVAQSFKEQLEFGVPTVAAETALRQLARQLRAGKVRVKLFLRYPLHAKLYLVRRTDIVTPLVGFLGSSNLTFAGLSKQGELNVDVVEQDAAEKLQQWFNARWDESAFDISTELADLIETSWAGEQLVLPYHVYLKMAYHLCEDALQGEREFKLPKVFQGVLLDFQKKAVSLAAHHIHRRGGVLLGDVVGLGKTLMATAVAKIFQEDDDSNTLIICPPKLREMWQWYVEQYQLTARVVSLGSVDTELENLRRYRLVIVDESHNLRNRESKRYAAVRDYIEQNGSRVLLVTATPYNKHFTDLSNQLRLFIDEDEDLHVRPERFFKEVWEKQGWIEADFIARFQASPRSLRAFEESEFADDWRDLMRLVLVRRTRQFIMQTYGSYDKAKDRYYVTLNGKPYYFPLRQPKTLKFDLDEGDPNDQYARLYRASVVGVIENLALPRYGLANYLVKDAEQLANADEKKTLKDLNRAGKRLIGFCRTNLFKRLESSGYSFLLSIARHILRNMIALHAFENNLPIPIGTQSAAMLDTAVSDEDADWQEDEPANENVGQDAVLSNDLAAYRNRAAQAYQTYRTQYRRNFQWIDGKFFISDLKRSLLEDAQALLGVLENARQWQPERDTKLDELRRLITREYPNDKVLVFTQFADTALYLTQQLQARGVKDMEAVTSDSYDPTALARRFSPTTNGGLRAGETELRVLIATDVLAEGQNLQDAHIVVNFDLPWAIIRLLQRAGRVDRIGQEHDTILAYSFMPAEGVEQIIRLRARLYRRLEQNQEVVGTDESFFGENAASKLRDLYTEKANALDDDADEDVDLASIAQQIWSSASEEDRKTVLQLPPVIPAARIHQPLPDSPSGAIVYLRFPDRTDALVRVDDQGNLVSQSLTATFRAAECAPETVAFPRAANHHELVAKAVSFAAQEQVTLGGQLGSMRSTRRKVYEHLKRFRELHQAHPNLFTADLLQRLDPAYNAIYRSPLKEYARDSLGRQIKLGITDEELAEMVIRMHEEDRLCTVTEEAALPEPQIVCSMGLRALLPGQSDQVA
jgi:superfamily II DNA or RNA helicase